MSTIKATKKAIGQQLMAFRKNKELSAYRVAKDGGITHTQVKIVESGESNYTIDVLIGYLVGCGLSLDFIKSSDDQ